MHPGYILKTTERANSRVQSQEGKGVREVKMVDGPHDPSTEWSSTARINVNRVPHSSQTNMMV